ncbi:MAG: ATP-dependent metallopeptidase FtsH/Yme1/Tma family protein, partial [Burkholderiales bacterium]
MQKHTQFNIAYLIFAFFAVLFVQQWWHQVQTVEVVPYSQFEKLLQESKIAEVVVSDQTVTGTLKSPQGGKSTVVANIVQPALADRLSKYDVKFTRVYQSTFLRDLLSWVVPALVFFGVWFFMVRR